MGGAREYVYHGVGVGGGGIGVGVGVRVGQLLILVKQETSLTSWQYRLGITSPHILSDHCARTVTLTLVPTTPLQSA